VLPNIPSDPGPVPLERPGPYAELEIMVGPARPWGTAKGRILPDQARYFILTFGILADVITGTAGAILTLHIAPGLIAVALAELILALAAALLTAACGVGRERARRMSNRRKERG
jgi:hypothetical protein